MSVSDVSGIDSPPEPAPPEVPPRGPSLHHPGGGHTLGRGSRAAQERQDIFLSQGKNFFDRFQT